MSRNIEQIYTDNPSTTLSSNDLIYSGKSPYGSTNDSAIKYSDLFTQIQSNIGSLNINMTGSNPAINFEGTSTNSITIVSGTSGSPGTTAPPFTFSTGVGGNSTSSNTGGSGGNYTVNAGNGGTSVSGTPGTGGYITLTAGNAGSSSAATGNLGGEVLINSGKGFTLTSGSSTAGGGGFIDITGGPGGDQQGTGQAGVGGGVSIIGGNAGASTNGPGGNGGSVSLNNGSGGNATSTNGNGGNSGAIRTINAVGGNGNGSGNGGTGGALTLSASKGGTGGSTGTAGNGGNATISGGAAGNGTSPGTAGNLVLEGGAASTLTSGTTAGGTSGSVTILTAVGGSAISNTGGNGGISGLISLTTGNGAIAPASTTSNGGSSGAININTGNGGSATLSNGNGGNAADITLTAGNGGDSATATSGNGGNIALICGNPGAGPTPGSNGNLTITTAAETWIWPTSDASGFMQSDGSGNLSFAQIPTVSYPPGYFYGLLPHDGSVSYQFGVTAGNCIDSTNTFNLNLPFGSNNDLTTNGVYGLDTGTFAASKIYCVYLIGDTTNVHTTATITSLGQNGPTAMPSGYNRWRFIGSIFSNASTQLYHMVYTGSGPVKDVLIDFASDSTILSSGNATSQTSIGILPNFLPNNDTISKVKFQAQFFPGIATDYARVMPFNFNAVVTGAPVVIGSGVSSVNFLTPFEVIPSRAFEIGYYVDHSSSFLTLEITGFTMSL